MCECVVIMRGYKEVNWKTAKGMMSDTNFLNTLKNMDVDGISGGQVHVLYVLSERASHLDICTCSAEYRHVYVHKNLSSVDNGRFCLLVRCPNLGVLLFVCTC